MNQRPASRGRGGRGNSRATVFNSPTQNIARLGSMTTFGTRLSDQVWRVEVYGNLKR